jgi:hypothetical protein
MSDDDEYESDNDFRTPSDEGQESDDESNGGMTFRIVENTRGDSYDDDDYDTQRQEDEEEETVNDQQFVQGVKQYEHMGEYDEYEDVLGRGLTMRERIRRFGVLSGEEKFKKIFTQYKNENEKFKTLNTANMKNLITKIKKIDYKNPKAFVIAYYFIQSERPDKELKEVVKSFCRNDDKDGKDGKDGDKENSKDDDDKDVSVIDVVRYVRMIRNL